MSKLTKKLAKKIGTPPGSLIHIGNYTNQKISITLYDYDATNLIEKKDASIQDCLIYLDSPLTTWINVAGIHDIKMIETLGKHFGLHPLILEDITNSSQRSKLDNFKDNIYIVMRLLKYDKQKDEVVDEQVSLVLGKNYVISFTEANENVFASVAERIKNKNSRIISRGADYLCYSLIDCIVDNYFIILECFDEKLETLEEKLISQPTPNVLQKIQKTKREIALLRKSVWPVREVVNQFKRLETPLIKEPTKLYMQDVYDHSIQAIDTIESFRDVSSGLLDIYISNISLRMNEIMKVLTVMATIFVPLTFIASLYGMNFDYMPELHSKWGYPAVLSVMGVVLLSMLYFFHRRKWI